MPDRTFISGPMNGHADHNREAFTLAAKQVTELGWTPVNPWGLDPAHDGTCPEQPPLHDTQPAHPYGCWLRAALHLLLTCDAIAMLPGWQQSRGARIEHIIATACDMPIHYL